MLALLSLPKLWKGLNTTSEGQASLVVLQFALYLLNSQLMGWRHMLITSYTLVEFLGAPVF